MNTDRSERPRFLTLLGATGSIGKSTLDVVSRHPESFRIHALTAHTAEGPLFDLCLRHRPGLAVLSGCRADSAWQAKFKAEAGTRLLFGPQALVEAAAAPQCDTVMAGIVGGAGLAPTIAAVEAGKRVLLANKEALVMAGALFMAKARETGATLLPVDSEHNAVFQCLPAAGAGVAVRRVVLTASGGPFRTLPLDRLARVAPEEACAHPNWVMGRKISVDSATMMNKGLEVIEARWLFDLPPERIDVVIHPQSIVHSMVEYVDGSVIAQMSNPDMRVPIAHALGFPWRIESGASWLDLTSTPSLSFEQPDHARFPCLLLAREALQEEGVSPAVLNAANEIAVEAFLERRIGFTAIAEVIATVRSRVQGGPVRDIAHVLDVDRAARAIAREQVDKAAELAA
ncbi:MAG: 1-deoxy-D-xylulose-5-phosphate reductoisomerase [Bradyrhizobium sp.]|uniref:1-deoxy-D-xylulose-5-phosphate reductoisomerase n=1 Tax=Bradyrhizobium sp. TaxID=376 RepID=UPI003D0E63CC